MGLIQPIHNSPILRGLGSFLQRAGAIQQPPQEVEIRKVIEEVIVEREARPQTGIGMPYYQSEDLSASQIKAIQQQAKNLWIKHPVAKKAMKLRRSFICDEGFKANAVTGNKRVQEFLDRHEAINWEGKTDDRVESMCVTGELAFWTPPCNRVNGHYELGMIKRKIIEEVRGSDLNAERPEKLLLSQDVFTWVDGERIPRREFDIYRYCWLRRQWIGEVLYLGINTLDDMHRGMSDLTPVIDWMRLFDTVCWTEGERLKMLRAFLMHLKIKGADDDTVKKWQSKLKNKPITGGSNWVSNENHEWEAISPDINSGPVLEYLKFIFGLVSGALDMPEHFYYTAGSVNRASAEEMKDPIYAAIRDRKRDFANFRAAEAQIAVQKAARIPGTLVYGLPREELEIEVGALRPERQAFEVIGQHLKSFSESLVIAENQEWISNEAAGQQFIEAASILGLTDLKSESVTEMKSEALEKLERRRPMLEGVYPLSIDGDPNWKVKGHPIAI